MFDEILDEISENRELSKREELARKAIKASYWYYVKSNPILRDYDYDMLFKELEKLESVGLANPKSPTQKIYGDTEKLYPEWAVEDRDLNNLGQVVDSSRYGDIEEVEAEKTFTTKGDWDYTFEYEHDLILHNPLRDREGEPVQWQTRSQMLKGKRIRVLSDYQAEWAIRNGAIPVRG